MVGLGFRVFLKWAVRPLRHDVKFADWELLACETLAS